MLVSFRAFLYYPDLSSLSVLQRTWGQKKMLLGNEYLLSKKEEIIKTVYISEILSLMNVPIKETKKITSVMSLKIKLFK